MEEQTGCLLPPMMRRREKIFSHSLYDWEEMEASQQFS